MDAKYLEPLVRRAVQEKFPDSLHTMFEILKRASVLGGVIPNMNGIPGIGENLNDAIRKLIFDNFYTIKGNVSLFLLFKTGIYFLTKSCSIMLYY